MRRLQVSAAGWLMLVALYLAFAGTLDAVEITCAIVAATIAIGLGFAMATINERRFAIYLSARAVLHPLAALLPDFLAVGRVLLATIAGQHRGGALVHQPFSSGGGDSRSTTRRAVTIISVSFTPRTFVVRGEDSDDLLLHGLPAKAPSPDHLWPA